MEDNIIYGLYCPVLNKPVYVGKSTLGLKRPLDHIKEKSHNKKVNEWISILKNNHNREPIIIILESSFPSKYINEKECFWINKFVSEGNLLLNIQSITPLIVDGTTITNKTENNPISNISYFIKMKRKQLKLTQLELSLLAGVGLRFIRDVEQCRKDNFNTSSIQKVLSLFGATLDVSIKKNETI